MPKFVFNKNNYQYDFGGFFDLQKEQQSVLTIWHVETFEGGTASRKSFLQKVAMNYNKKNKNCFFVIKQMNLEQFKINLENNQQADIYSFGVGAGQYLSESLEVLSKNNNIRSDLSLYGFKQNNCFAYPYILSGYVCITRQKYCVADNKNKILLSKNVNNTIKPGFGFTGNEVLNFSKVLVENGFKKLDEKDYFSCDNFYEAYNMFLADKFCTLIGTARDLARCKNREQLGSLSECQYNFLEGYSDLIQYIGVNKNLDEIKMKIAKDFCEFITNENSQEMLKNYGLFTINNNLIYESGYMKDFELILHKNLKSTNVFATSEQILQNKQDSYKDLFSIK